jgi:signal transduction histidine kinase
VSGPRSPRSLGALLAPAGHGGARRPRFAWPPDTGRMPRTVNWLARAVGFAWLGPLAFLIAPPREPSGAAVPFAVPVQAAGYCLLGLGLLAWLLIDLHPRAARDRAWWFPVILGVIAVAAGFASAAGGGGTATVAFGFVAAMIAGSDTGLAAGLAVTAAGILAIEVSGLAVGGNYGNLFGLPAIVAAGLLIGRNRGAYRIRAEQAAALLAQREQLQSEQRRADLLDERARIAREIHDVLAHSLGALGIQIQAARAVLADHGDTDRAGDLLAAAQQMAAEGLVETRRAVHALRTDTLPLDEELARVSDAYAQRYRVAVSFDTGGVPAALPPDATIALLRIAQEALVNAAKHAAGQGVTVRLDYSEADVRLTVRNDLAAADGVDRAACMTTVNGGYGLTGMRERLRLLNGTLEAGRRGGQWIVTAELPRRAGPARPHPESMTS